MRKVTDRQKDGNRERERERKKMRVFVKYRAKALKGRRREHTDADKEIWTERKILCLLHR
jgi:hypothetical protein